MLRIGIVGAGALGCSVIPGLGKYALCIADGDRVEEANLARQPLYSSAHVGRWKAEVLAERFPNAGALTEFLSAQNTAAFLASNDLIIDLADDLHLTKLLDRQCEEQRKPLLVAAVHQGQGQVYFLHHHAHAPAWRNLFTGQLGAQQDGCDMRSVSRATINAVGAQTLRRLAEFETGVQSNALDLFVGTSWQQFQIAKAT